MVTTAVLVDIVELAVSDRAFVFVGGAVRVVVGCVDVVNVDDADDDDAGSGRA